MQHRSDVDFLGEGPGLSEEEILSPIRVVHRMGPADTFPPMERPEPPPQRATSWLTMVLVLAVVMPLSVVAAGTAIVLLGLQLL